MVSCVWWWWWTELAPLAQKCILTGFEFGFSLALSLRLLLFGFGTCAMRVELQVSPNAAVERYPCQTSH